MAVQWLRKSWWWMFGLWVLGGGVAAAMHPGTVPDEKLLRSAYAGGERFVFQVTWLGVPAGELEMRTEHLGNERYGLTVVARSIGLLAVFYPVEDRFFTVVEGRARLPMRHEMDQREGSRVNRRLALYDHAKYSVSQQKNDNPPEVYALDGPVHNEFSSFFVMRALRFGGGERVVVPTFADKKRHEVEVSQEGREESVSVLGVRPAIKVRPRLAFKGLYSKVADPLIWLTDDEDRIPLRIQAKIVIGSLTADLIEYSGPSGSWRRPPAPVEPPGEPARNGAVQP
ncbi:MAG: DUF3108 domain-containing protein [Thermodesulfobacteriota bacterium]